MEQALVTRGLNKNYGDLAALVDLDLTVEAGVVFGFLGPNGAGKTTAIRVFMDEIRSSSGSASILGHDVHQDSVALHRKVGYLPSDLALYPNMTGTDLLHFFAIFLMVVLNASFLLTFCRLSFIISSRIF